MDCLHFLWSKLEINTGDEFSLAQTVSTLPAASIGFRIQEFFAVSARLLTVAMRLDAHEQRRARQI